MSFKEQLSRDLDTFLNTNEFADLHTVDGVPLKAVIDNAQREHPYSYAEGISLNQLQMHVKVTELGYRPVPNQRIDLDGRTCIVAAVAESEGMYQITLESNTD